jgi:hypothetical protein
LREVEFLILITTTTTTTTTTAAREGVLVYVFLQEAGIVVIFKKLPTSAANRNSITYA